MRFRQLLVRFSGCRRGNVLITFTLSITILMAAAGLGAEVASWYSQRRDMQNAADLGADSAIVSLSSNFNSANATTQGYANKEAKASAKSHGYTDGSASTTVQVAIKPDTPVVSDSVWTAAPNYGVVEVVITKPASLYFASLFLSTAPSISVRSVAKLDYQHSNCMGALSLHQDMSFQVIGSSNLQVDCSIFVNSDDTGTNGNGQRNNALYLQGGNGVNLVGYDISVVGTWGGPGNATMTPTDKLINPASVTTDPYATTTIPSDCGCDTDLTSAQVQTDISNGTALTGGGNITGDLNISGTLTLNSGIYVVNGNINVNSGGTLITNGATIILNSTATTNYTFNMQSSQANVNFTAPNSSSSLSTKGFALMQSRSAPTDVIDSNGNCTVNCSVLQGGPTTSITGVIYLPSGDLSYQGNPSTTSGCTQLFADTLQYQGGPLFVNACSGTGVTLSGPTNARLAE